MPPERSLPHGAIFARPDVTQRQFEAKTKAYCGSEQNEAATQRIQVRSVVPCFAFRCGGFAQRGQL